MELTLDQMPKIPDGLSFSLDKIDKITQPHPYCITEKHVAVASDYHSGILDGSAIEDAEKRGARCGVRGCTVSWEGHETFLALFIRVPQNKDLNAVEGLNRYLFDNKAEFERLGIQGFAFPV